MWHADGLQMLQMFNFDKDPVLFPSAINMQMQTALGCIMGSQQ
jgi:hypothetical protein